MVIKISYYCYYNFYHIFPNLTLFSRCLEIVSFFVRFNNFLLLAPNLILMVIKILPSYYYYYNFHYIFPNLALLHVQQLFVIRCTCCIELSIVCNMLLSCDGITSVLDSTISAITLLVLHILSTPQRSAYFYTFSLIVFSSYIARTIVHGCIY